MHYCFVPWTPTEHKALNRITISKSQIEIANCFIRPWLQIIKRFHFQMSCRKRIERCHQIKLALKLNQKMDKFNGQRWNHGIICIAFIRLNRRRSWKKNSGREIKRSKLLNKRWTSKPDHKWLECLGIEKMKRKEY